MVQCECGKEVEQEMLDTVFSGIPLEVGGFYCKSCWKKVIDDVEKERAEEEEHDDENCGC